MEEEIIDKILAKNVALLYRKLSILGEILTLKVALDTIALATDFEETALLPISRRNRKGKKL